MALKLTKNKLFGFKKQGVQLKIARFFIEFLMKKIPEDVNKRQHSNCEIPGIAGLCEVSQLAYPDRLQFIKGHKYFDEKATPENPRWVNVDVKLVRKTRLLSLKEMREMPELANLRILQRGNRLSITPVDPRDWTFILSKL